MQVLNRRWRIGRCRAGVWALLTFLGCLADVKGADTVAPALPVAPPAIVVDGSINLTWAANHSAYWRERGVDGFIVYGLDSVFHAPEAEKELGESPLLREIRVAQQRLRVAGLGRNFFHWDIGNAWVSENQPRESLRTQAGQAARFARDAGLQGVAIDLPRDGAALLNRAQATTYTPTALEERRQQLHETGLRIVRALLGGHPHGEIMLLAEAPLNAGRDWWALVEGMLAGPDAAPVPLHFVDRSSRTLDRPLDYQDRREALQQHAQLALTDKGLEDWNRHGAPGFNLSLFENGERGVAAAHSLESARLLSLAAATFSHHYVLVNSPPGGLWEVTDTRAERYEDFQQDVPVEATPPLLPLAHQINLNTPVSRLKRIGPYHDEDGAPVFVFQSHEGAAVLFWGGLAAPTKLPSRAAMVEQWNPGQARTRSLVPEDGYIVLPPHKAPLLVRGLPVGDWSLPAALVLQPEKPFRAQDDTNFLSLAIRNPLTVPLEADVSLWAPEGIGTGRQTVSVNMAPGAAHHVEREIHGDWSAGDQLDFRLVLTQPGRGILTRRFPISVAPDRLWQRHLPAEVSAAPAVLEISSDTSLMALLSGNRYVTAFDAHGTLAWEYDHGVAGGLQTLPLIGAGGKRLALVSGNGAILLLDHRGKAVTVPAPTEAEHGQPIAYWNHQQSAAPYFLTLRDGKTLTARDTEGTPVWEKSWQEGPTLLPPQHPMNTRGLPPPPLILFFPNAAKPALERLGRSGETQWRFEAPDTSRWDALLFYGKEGWQIGLWDRSEQLLILEATTGQATTRRLSVLEDHASPYRMQPVPAEGQVRLMLQSKAHDGVLTLDQRFRKATTTLIPRSDHIRAYSQHGRVMLWGLRGTRPVGLLPRWDDSPLGKAPTSLQTRVPGPTPELHLYIVGGTEIRVLAP